MPRRRLSSMSLAALPIVLAALLHAPSVAETAGETSAGRAFEIADYYATAFVGSPTVDPRGEWIAFTVRRYDLEAGESASRLFRMRAEGGDAVPLTPPGGRAASPAWKPDGSALLFVDDREESGSELWLLPTDGGEARRLTDAPVDLSDPVWSPDGRWIAVTALVDPDCGADLDCTAERVADREAAPLRAHVADGLLYRHWTSWSDGLVPHVLLVDASDGHVVRDLTPGPYPAPTFGSDGAAGYRFSPASDELCFVSNHDPRQALSTNADLWVVPVAGGPPRNLTGDNAGWDGHPAYSPDGRYLAWLRQTTPGYESDLYRLMLLDRRSGETRTLLDRDRFDNPLLELTWSPDSRALFLSADVEGRTPLYRYDLHDGSLEHVHTDAVLAGFDLSPDGKWIAYTRSRMGEPFELFRVDADGRHPRRLSHFNDALVEEVDFRPAEEIHVEVDGRPIQAWLIKPHGFDPAQRYPLIVNVHGGPQGSWNDRYRGDWQVYPGKGYVVLCPNPTGSTGWGQEFTDAIVGDWGGQVFEDIMGVVDAVAAEPWIDENRMGAMGWSYGGYMMMWMQGHTDRFVCQAAMMGLYDLRSFHGATEELWFPRWDLRGDPWTSEDYERWSPSNAVENFSTPALVITGELDFRVPYTQSLQYFTDLQLRGVPSRLVVFPKSGHWPRWHDMVFYYLAHLDWFHRYLGGDPPPWDVQDYLDGRAFDDGE